ncbi:MAG: hypothetical protein QM742_16195 [Aquabacterium sp.]
MVAPVGGGSEPVKGGGSSGRSQGGGGRAAGRADGGAALGEGQQHGLAIDHAAHAHGARRFAVDGQQGHAAGLAILAGGHHAQQLQARHQGRRGRLRTLVGTRGGLGRAGQQPAQIALRAAIHRDRCGMDRHAGGLGQPAQAPVSHTGGDRGPNDECKDA